MRDIWREGKWIMWPSLFAFLICAGLFAFFLNKLIFIPAGISAFIFGYTYFFLRIPTRKVTQDEDIIYASADGYVFAIEENVKAPAYIDQPVHKVVIFMHVASVHWNYSPMEGKIGFLDYKKGLFKNVIKPSAWDVNEHLLIGMENDKNKTKILISLIAGLIARRIRFFREKDSYVGQGERFGLIKYGSANTLYLPASEFEIVAKKGQKTRATQTIIAKRKKL